MTEKQEATAEDSGKLDSTKQLIVFRQGDEEYGLHIDQVKEVVLTPHITKMPQTPFYMKGVTNVRGNIISIIDLEEKFGIKEVSSTEKANEINNYTLVIASDEYKVGVLVRDVPNTLTVKESIIEKSVNIIHDNTMDSEYIKGIVKLDERLIIMIDIFKVLNEQDLDKIKKQDKGGE